MACGIPVASSNLTSMSVSVSPIMTRDGSMTPSSTRSGAMYHLPLTPLYLHCLPSFIMVTPRFFNAPLYHLRYDFGLTDLCLFTTDPVSVSTSSVYTSSIISDRVNTRSGFWSSHSSNIVTCTSTVSNLVFDWFDAFCSSTVNHHCTPDL